MSLGGTSSNSIAGLKDGNGNGDGDEVGME